MFDINYIYIWAEKAFAFIIIIRKYFSRECFCVKCENKELLSIKRHILEHAVSNLETVYADCFIWFGSVVWFWRFWLCKAGCAHISITKLLLLLLGVFSLYLTHCNMEEVSLINAVNCGIFILYSEAKKKRGKNTENDTKVCFILLCIKYSINLCKIDLFSLEKRAKTDVFGLKLPFSVLKPFNINCVQQKRMRYV